MTLFMFLLELFIIFITLINDLPSAHKWIHAFFWISLESIWAHWHSWLIHDFFWRAYEVIGTHDLIHNLFGEHMSSLALMIQFMISLDSIWAHWHSWFNSCFLLESIWAHWHSWFNSWSLWRAYELIGAHDSIHAFFWRAFELIGTHDSIHAFFWKAFELIDTHDSIHDFVWRAYEIIGTHELFLISFGEHLNSIPLMI